MKSWLPRELCGSRFETVTERRNIETVLFSAAPRVRFSPVVFLELETVLSQFSSLGSTVLVWLSLKHELTRLTTVPRFLFCCFVVPAIETLTYLLRVKVDYTCFVWISNFHNLKNLKGKVGKNGTRKVTIYEFLYIYV